MGKDIVVLLVAFATLALAQSQGLMKPTVSINVPKQAAETLPDSLLKFPAELSMQAMYCKVQAKDGNVLYGQGGTVPTRDHQFAKVLNAAAITDSGARGRCVFITAQPFSDSMWVRLVATRLDTAANFRPYLIMHAKTNYILVKPQAAFSAETNATTDTAFTVENGAILYKGASKSFNDLNNIQKVRFVLRDSTVAAKIDVTVGAKR